VNGSDTTDLFISRVEAETRYRREIVLCVFRFHFNINLNVCLLPEMCLRISRQILKVFMYAFSGKVGL
jgi:hypothetical protein